MTGILIVIVNVTTDDVTNDDVSVRVTTDDVSHSTTKASGEIVDVGRHATAAEVLLQQPLSAVPIKLGRPRPNTRHVDRCVLNSQRHLSRHSHRHSHTQ